MARVLQPFEYFEPDTMSEALSLTTDAGSKLLAGGCELVLSMRRQIAHYDRLVSIRHVPGLDVFYAHPKRGLEAGAQVKIGRLARDIWVSKRFGALHEAIDQLHPPHILNMGTLVGNVCSAVPYTDIPLGLMALRAEVRIDSITGRRAIPLENFYIGPKATAVRPGEMVTSIFIPPPAASAASAFRKIYKAPRREGDLHKVNAAAYLALDIETDTIIDATVVVGCCSFAAYRVPEAEQALVGVLARTQCFERAADIAAGSVKPMTDAGWVEEVRAQFVRVLVRDVLEHAASRARMKTNHFDDADDIISG